MIWFDLGSTLEDETPAQRARAEATASWAAERGLAFSADDVLAAQRDAAAEGVASAYPEALRRLGLNADDHAELRRLHPWNAALCRPVPGVRRLLEGLRLRYRLGVLANQSKPMAARLSSYGIAEAFGVLICSCEVGMGKPDPAIFRLAEQEALRQGDRGPHTMVGDRVDNDILPARRLGWATVRVLAGDYAGYRSRGPEEIPDFEARDLAEAVAYLEAREGGIRAGTGGGPGYGRR